MTCKYAEINEEGVVCAEIVKRVGVRCGMNAKFCEACRFVEGGDTTIIDAHTKSHIRNLLISGNQPRFADTVDVPAMAARFNLISTKAERENVVAKAIECQCIPEEKGGCDAATLVANLTELEKLLKVANVVEKLV